MRIRYFGHMGEPTGYGVAAERYCEALSQRSDVDLDEININTLEARAGIAIAQPNERWLDCTGVDAVIVHTLPTDCIRFAHRLDVPKDTPAIAYTTWEALTMRSQEAQSLTTVFSEVWTPSEASRKAIAGERGTDVHVVPHCFDVSVRRRTVPLTDLRGGAPFRFYWIGAWNARKNPSGVIRAFAHAFTAKDHVELYLHSHGTPVEALIAEMAATGIPQNELARIRLNSEYLPDDTMEALHARGDCFVTASRGEAWNLPCFEALCHHNLIITTENLGSDDYLIDTDAQRVNARRAPAWNTLSRTVSAAGEVGAHILGAQGLTSRDLWLEPDIERFAKTMRRVYESRVRKTTINYSLTERYSYAPVAQMILNRLEALR